MNKKNNELTSKMIFDYELGSFKPPMDNLFPLSSEDQETVDKFHKLYFKLLEKKPGLLISWLGVQTGKVPSDLWIYQEIISELKPDVIIECGTHHGGSAFFLASICQLIDKGRIITIDVFPRENRPNHKLIEYINGSSTSTETFKKVTSSIGDNKNILVLLDSNHSKEHVMEELKLYSKLVPIGGLLIVEDTFLNGNPSHEEFGPGPMEAIDEFLSENKEFQIDRAFERFLFTLNRRGFLRKIS
jgi:cephalosporin hydroxylase